MALENRSSRCREEAGFPYPFRRGLLKFWGPVGLQGLGFRVYCGFIGLRGDKGSGF